MLLDLKYSFPLHLLVAGKHTLVFKLAHDKFVHDEWLTLSPTSSFPEVVNHSFFIITPLCYMLLSYIHHMESLFIRMCNFSPVAEIP